MPLGLASICREENLKRTDSKKVNSFCGDNNEPTSVLLMRRSPTPSPPTSTSISTLSSSLNGGGSAIDKKDEWANELQPILAAAGAGRCSLALEDWETMLSDPVSATAEPGHEQFLMRWTAGGDINEASLLGLKQLLQSSKTTNLDFAANTNSGVLDQGSVLDPTSSLVSGSGFPSSGFYADLKLDQIPVTVGTTGDSCVMGDVQGSNFSNLVAPITPHSSMNLVFQSLPPFNQLVEEKPQPLVTQNPNLLIPPPYNHQEHHVLPPPSKRHNSIGSDNHLSLGHGVSFGSDTNLQVLPQQLQHHPPLMAATQEVQQAHYEEETQNLLDQLYKAVELVGTANFSHAQAILARLNHQLSPTGKHLQRAAYYFKEALRSLLFRSSDNQLPWAPTSFDVIFKMGAYKAFSEISPLIQFTNFTANQAFLEALDRCNTIHIVDFDIGFGAQWASFLQELPLRRRRITNEGVEVRITAVTSPSTHHPIELALMQESLTQFSHEVGVSLELQVLNVDCVEHQDTVYRDFTATLRADEAVAVNLPVWCSSVQSARLSSVIRFIKGLSPRIVVCLDSDCAARTDVPFPQHVLHLLHRCSDLLESMDAVGFGNTEVVRRIERFLILPRIESALSGHLFSNRGDKTQQWRGMLESVGLAVVPFSNFTEAQAECLVKMTPTHGFHVGKRHGGGSLLLCWKHRELVSVSAWR